MARASDRLPPTLEAFQTILSTGEDREASLGILNATGVTERTNALFEGADVDEIDRLLRAAEEDLAQRTA